MINLINGDCIETLRALEHDSYGAVITDPPYSSGGIHLGDRTQPTSKKYLRDGNQTYRCHDFGGDAMDQQSWMLYTADWLRLARRAVQVGGVAAVFCDWRQLSACINALQMAGWTYRGVAVWDKTLAVRPQRGRYRAQAEYIVWGSNGAMPLDRCAPTLPGIFRVPIVPATRRVHQTEKPIELMREIIHICETGTAILDPFAGSGTTAAACKLEGYDCMAIEIDQYYYKVMERRVEQIGDVR